MTTGRFTYTRVGPLLMVFAAGLLLAASGTSGLAQGDPSSVPYEPAIDAQAPDGGDAAAMSQEADEGPSGPTLPSFVGIGLNFETSRLGGGAGNSGFIPPDTMGAVGPNHIVEMINGNFEIFDKATGASLVSRSLDGFWTTDVGLTIPPFNDVCNLGTGVCSVSGDPCDNVTQFCRSNGTYDPRIVYDPASGRWFATSLDRTNPATGDNNIYVARSDTDDPQGDWDGFFFDADTVAPPEFHDYDTLAVDADGLYTCTQDFDSGSGGGGVESCYSIPKADLLLAVPTAANLTRFENSPPGLPSVSGSMQPVFDVTASDGRAAMMGAVGGIVVRTDILGAGAAGATLGLPIPVLGAPPHAAPPDARQPHPTGRTIENVAPRFVSNVFERGDSIWAVHSVAGSSGNAALRWYEIDEVTSIVIQTGLIENANIDFHEPSIVANEFGIVVIGYTCSGPNLAPSACVSAGKTVGGVTTFEAPLNVAQGAGYYFQGDRNDRNRWGDYSATVVDPVRPCTFWTFQEIVAVGATDPDPRPGNDDGLWGTQVTELAFYPPVATVPGEVFVTPTCVGETGVATLEVCNTTPNEGICANLIVEGITSDDPRFVVTEPSSGFPVVISPDFCFPFEVRYTPDGTGSQSAVLTVRTNDPSVGEVDVVVNGSGTEPDIATIIANAGSFGDVCIDHFKDLNLTISNGGGCDLTVDDITSSAPEFQVAGVMFFPLVIGPGDSLAVPIRFAPTSLGAKSATITIDSDDPDSPVRTVTVSGNVPPGDIRVTGSTDFGDVCAEELAEKTVSVCNVGPCNLNVASVTVDCPDFTLINNPFPAPVSPDSCQDVVIRFTPTSVGPKSCTLTITSDDPDMPVVERTVTGTTPYPSIDVPPDQAFPPTVIQDVGACRSLRPFPVSNTGECNLHITDLAITTNPDEYGFSGLPSFPIILEPGHVAGEGDLRTVFEPDVLDRDRLGALAVTYVSDPITGATTTVGRDLCGEGVLTGVRVLATIGGVPIPTGDVFKLQLQRVTGNRKKRGLISIDVLKDPPLQTVTPAAPCTPYQFHGEFGTVDNPVQLLPGFYNVTVTARVDGRRKRKTAGFDLLTCDFNRNVVIDFNL